MDEMERLMRQDRVTAIPDPPDERYTVAVIKRRLGAPRTKLGTDWPLLVAAPVIAMGLALLAVQLGVNPWWLLTIPLAALPLTPILLDKGEG